MDDLVNRLASGKHPVIASRVISAQELKDSIDRGYVIVKFTDTRGGTELGIRLDQDNTVLTYADEKNVTDAGHLEGFLTLNYVKVRCVVDLDLSTLQGHGFLEILGKH